MVTKERISSSVAAVLSDGSGLFGEGMKSPDDEEMKPVEDNVPGLSFMNAESLSSAKSLAKYARRRTSSWVRVTDATGIGFGSAIMKSMSCCLAPAGSRTESGLPVRIRPISLRVISAPVSSSKYSVGPTVRN